MTIKKEILKAGIDEYCVISYNEGKKKQILKIFFWDFDIPIDESGAVVGTPICSDDSALIPIERNVDFIGDFTECANYYANWELKQMVGQEVKK